LQEREAASPKVKGTANTASREKKEREGRTKPGTAVSPEKDKREILRSPLEIKKVSSDRREKGGNALSVRREKKMGHREGN